MKFTIAIDGPAAAGKGTISKAIALEFGLSHLDTGLLYRAVGRKVLNGSDALHAAQNLTQEDLARDDLRNAEVAQVASKVAAIGAVRTALVAFQQEFARRDGGAVLDGRDIATVICPQAEVKIFVTARPEIRAERRLQELVCKGAETNFATVLADVRERDARDMGRADAPMRQADDAVLLDTSDLAIGEAVDKACQIVRDAMKHGVN